MSTHIAAARPGANVMLKQKKTENLLGQIRKTLTKETILCVAKR